jgi:uncharacterized RDD family membrane protein YckC
MECPHCRNQISSTSKHCIRCGKAIPAGQYLLEEVGVIEPAHATTSVSTTTSTASPSAARRKTGQYRFARLGDRFIAFALDTALLFGLFAVVDAWALMRWGWVEGSELQLTTASLLIAVTLNATILFLYGWLLEAGFGATLGKAMVGIRVVGAGQRGSFSAAAVRNVLRIVDGLCLYLVGTAVAVCSDVRQRIGDICAQTAVVEESFGIGIKVAAIVLWMATLAGAGWAVPRICSADDSVHGNPGRNLPAQIHPGNIRFLDQVVVRVGRTENAAYFRIGRFTLDAQLASTAP